ncbi:MAG TPA: peptidyl-prolyl cis-trans isomerase [Terriglobales bacterium]|nr:peptidyl-prolyl cis-trans isomerase [Terriglobales bacterium]
MIRCAVLCLVFASLAWGQTPSAPPSGSTPPASSAAPAKSPAQALPEAPSASSPNKLPDTSTVPPDEAVITIEGLCDKPPAAPPAECKTVVTRADFEKIVNTVQPTMTLPQQRQLANNYATVLMMAKEAHRMGLDQGPDFDERMRLARLEVLMQMVIRNVRTQSAEVPDKEVADFYQAHQAQYERASMLQLFIPLMRETAAGKTSAATPAKTPAEKAEVMKKEAEALRTRAANGEDFSKLQAEAFQYAGVKTPPPDTHLANLRRSSLSQARASVMELKPGEVSQVIPDPTGFFVYKMEKKDSAPLDEVRNEITAQLKAQRTQEAMQSLRGLGKPEFDEKYFGSAPPAQRMPMVPGPAGPGANVAPRTPPRNASPASPNSSSSSTPASPGPK